MDNGEVGEKVRILLVEDNPADIRMIQEIFKDSKTKSQIYTVTDGMEALYFLNKKGKYENMDFPDLILLDLNLPKMDGQELLKEITKYDEIKKIPVVILTTSNHEIAIINTFELQTCCFISKPITFDDYKLVLEKIKEFWFKLQME